MSSLVPIACTLGATDRQARAEVISRLLANATTIEERADGYAFAFPPDATQARALLEFALAERECCAFITFAIHFPAPHDQVWLELRGNAEVKEVISAMFVESR